MKNICLSFCYLYGWIELIGVGNAGGIIYVCVFKRFEVYKGRGIRYRVVKYLL